MFFRLDCKIRELRIAGISPSFSYGDPHPVTVSLRRPTPDEIEAEEDREDARCTSIMEQTPPQGFDEVVKGAIMAVSTHSFPVETQAHLREVRREIGERTLTVINTVRWKVGDRGPHEPFRDALFSYSFDGAGWGEIGPALLLRRTSNLPIYFSEDGEQAITELLNSGETEPIAHDILREAWGSRFTNPRSALILGVAALEVGFKQCLVRLVPNAAWLIRRSTPPTATMLRDYLPEVLRDRGHLHLYAPPKEAVKKIEAAITARNTFVHQFPGSPRYRAALDQTVYITLEESLLLIGDLLWFFDYYVGVDWSINRVRAATMQLLIDRHGGGSLPHRNGA